MKHIAVVVSTNNSDVASVANVSAEALRAEAAEAILTASAAKANVVGIVGFQSGKPGAATVIIHYLPVQALTIPANLAGTRCFVGTNPAAPVSLSVQKNAVEVATIAIAADGSITLSTQAAVSLAITDKLTVVAPGSQDANLADIWLTISATR